MKHHHRLHLEPAPDWAEESRPCGPTIVHTILLIEVPGEDWFEVASNAVARMVSDPESPTGRLYWKGASYLGLGYLSDN